MARFHFVHLMKTMIRTAHYLIVASLPTAVYPSLAPSTRAHDDEWVLPTETLVDRTRGSSRSGCLAVGRATHT